jgi:hypothetical protein
MAALVLLLTSDYLILGLIFAFIVSVFGYMAYAAYDVSCVYV